MKLASLQFHNLFKPGQRFHPQDSVTQNSPALPTGAPFCELLKNRFQYIRSMNFFSRLVPEI